MILYKETKDITDSELRQLYNSVKWYAYTKRFDNLTNLLRNCPLVLTAWDDDKLVGMIRTVGDGIYIQYVQDFLVHPDYQKHGIGSNLWSQLLEKSKDIYQLVLMTDNGPETQYVRDFYNKNGMKSFEESETIGFVRFGPRV